METDSTDLDRLPALPYVVVNPIAAPWIAALGLCLVEMTRSIFRLDRHDGDRWSRFSVRSSTNSMTRHKFLKDASIVVSLIRTTICLNPGIGTV